MSPEQIRRIGKQPRPHGIALACDRIGASARTANVAGHECKIDDCLRCSSCFVALVHSHRPPKRNSLSGMNDTSKSLESIHTQACSRAHGFGCKRLNKLQEFLETA